MKHNSDLKDLFLELYNTINAMRTNPDYDDAAAAGSGAPPADTSGSVAGAA